MSRIDSNEDNKNTQAGFTIVELMIATIVFSMVLLVCSYAIIHVGRMYYKGVIMGRTQDVARQLVDDVSETIIYSDKANYSQGIDGAVESRCFGFIRYTFVRGVVAGESNTYKHVFWKDSEADSTCTPRDLTLDKPSSTEWFSTGKIGDNMRLTKFDIDEPGVTNPYWNIKVTVSYGDEDDFVPEDPGATPPIDKFSICKGVSAGGQFCAVSSYSTTVKNRL